MTRTIASLIPLCVPDDRKGDFRSSEAVKSRQPTPELVLAGDVVSPVDESIVARPSENAAWGEIVAVSGEN